MAGRKVIRNIDGLPHQKCIGELHNGAWLPLSEFPKAPYKVKSGERRYITMPRCRVCRNLHSARHKRPSSVNPGLVSVYPYQKFLIEIVARCGGYNAAARTLGIHMPALYRWLNRGNSRPTKYISRRNALHVLLTLQGLRNGTIKPVTRKKGGKIFKHGCKGCGINPIDYNPDCRTCAERRLGRDKRARNGSVVHWDKVA